MNQAKLVRDKIPEIIRAEGLEPVIRTATIEEGCGSSGVTQREELQACCCRDVRFCGAG
jgi:predicted house-cleaning noncanonical NTP pyrophosphatase (MazG superfamily)